MAVIDWTPIRAAWPRLLARAGRLVDAMGLNGRVSEEDVVQAAVEALLDRGCPDGIAPIRALQMNLLQAASNIARQRRLLPLDESTDAGVDPVAGADHVDSLDDRALCSSVIDALGRGIDGDDDAVLLLSAYAELADSVVIDVKRARAEIMTLTGLDEKRHMNAVRRLNTALGRLPVALRSRVIERLRGGP